MILALGWWAGRREGKGMSADGSTSIAEVYRQLSDCVSNYLKPLQHRCPIAIYMSKNALMGDNFKCYQI